MSAFRRVPAAGIAALIAAVVLCCAAGAQSPGPSGVVSTMDQATRGQFVFVQHCVICHGAQLQGVAAPPLQGPRFGRSMAAAHMTTQKLYTFISTAMPINEPGTLKPQQYEDVLAFILRRNGYRLPAKLGKGTFGQVALLPYPNLAPAPEQSPAPSPFPDRSASVPSSANVALDDAALRNADNDANDWALPGRTYANWRYSPLRQIDVANVGRLQPVKIVHTGIFESFETTPLVVDGIMYLTTPVRNHVMRIMALNATNGDTIWSTTYHVGEFKACCGPNNRGPALGYGNLYVTTLDAKLLALDARTGKERWETQVADPGLGYSESMAPQIYGGSVIVGSAGGEWSVRGFVAAYDAQTGKQRWRWDATDPKTFAGNSWKGGGGTVWTTPAIDQQRGLLIFSTGNPNPDVNGSSRAGINLYTDCIVALDVNTGKLRWYYQEVAHDVWDYDATSNVVLFDVHSGGRTIPAAGQAGKVGWFFIVDRTNGKLLRKSQPFVQQNKNMFKQKLVLPGANGGSEWSPPAYSPQTREVYLLGINQLMNFNKSPANNGTGIIQIGSTWLSTAKPAVQTGTFTAIDVDTGRIRWQHTMPKPMVGGALATAGGLVFVGEPDGSFDAFDAAAGTKLWSYSFVAGVNAPPITYAVNGTQYVAVAAGGSFQFNYLRGDAVGIFKLK